MSQDNELPVIRATYEFVVWLIPKIGKFPRDLRFTLGERLENQALTVLELLIRAQYQKKQVEILDFAAGQCGSAGEGFSVRSVA